MNSFITEIPRQHIIIDGVYYSAEDIIPSADNGKSKLQLFFEKRYGEDSFHVDLSKFLSEWFDSSETISVQTSGSTGAPKKMQVEKKRMMNSAMLTVSFLNIQKGDTAQLCMPLKYIAGKMVVIRALVAELNLIPITPCGHPMETLPVAPTFSAMIPMQVYNSLQNPRECELLKQVKHLIIGGGSIDDSLSNALKYFPEAVWSTYGMTETLSHIALRKLSGKDASIWYTPLPEVNVSISDCGTLVIDAPKVSSQTLVTNDIAVFNERGQFRILGRKDNTINTGGVKVQIEQVEALLKPLLSTSFMITSIPDPKFGERIVLLLENSFNISFKTVHQAIDTLPPYWQPKEILYALQLPLTETGKPDRAKAKKLALELSKQ